MRTCGEPVIPIHKMNTSPSGRRNDVGSPQISVTRDPFSSTVSLVGSVGTPDTVF
jgi:hypothetical protein